MPDLRKAQDGEKWEPIPNIWWWNGALHADGRRAILVTCSQGHRCCIGHVHYVAADGTVTPSFICPTCSEHTMLRLLDWAPTLT